MFLSGHDTKYSEGYCFGMNLLICFPLIEMIKVSNGFPPKKCPVYKDHSGIRINPHTFALTSDIIDKIFVISLSALEIRYEIMKSFVRPCSKKTTKCVSGLLRVGDNLFQISAFVVRFFPAGKAGNFSHYLYLEGSPSRSVDRLEP